MITRPLWARRPAERRVGSYRTFGYAGSWMWTSENSPRSPVEHVCTLRQSFRAMHLVPRTCYGLSRHKPLAPLQRITPWDKRKGVKIVCMLPLEASEAEANKEDEVMA